MLCCYTVELCRPVALMCRWEGLPNSLHSPSWRAASVLFIVLVVSCLPTRYSSRVMRHSVFTLVPCNSACSFCISYRLAPSALRMCPACTAFFQYCNSIALACWVQGGRRMAECWWCSTVID